jgi:two-component system chemotaxis response regulator CheY
MATKIMVVDDSRTVRQQVGMALGCAGFEIIEATDGIEGCARIEQHPDLALVILDINMPRMDGLEMLDIVKGDARHADLPIVMLTTEGQPSLVLRAKAAGAKGWIVKPFKADMLLATVRKLARVA